jgi:hypothetical protein
MNKTIPITEWDDPEMSAWVERLRRPPRRALFWFVVEGILTLLWP